MEWSWKGVVLGEEGARRGLEYSVEESVYWEVESVYNISVYLL